MLAVEQFEFHVALTAGKPDLADKHIIEFQHVVARDDAQRIRTALGLRGKHHPPWSEPVSHVLRSVGVGLRDQQAVKIVDFSRNLKAGAIGV